MPHCVDAVPVTFTDLTSNVFPLILRACRFLSHCLSLEQSEVLVQKEHIQVSIVWHISVLRSNCPRLSDPSFSMFFSDFVDVARHLVDTKKLTTPDRLTCEGRSAGGLLIGASINQAPELFKVAILGVPFLDVVCTMTDARIPLTTGEWDEWGNPNEEKYHGYMMEYCPMQNVRAGATYPACLITGGLHDSRVAFWEPAKFAATLRHATGADSGPVCMKIELSAGHFSASDRYKYLRELAYDYAFLLDQRGLADAKVENGV